MLRYTCFCVLVVCSLSYSALHAVCWMQRLFVVWFLFVATVFVGSAIIIRECVGGAVIGRLLRYNLSSACGVTSS